MVYILLALVTALLMQLLILIGNFISKYLYCYNKFYGVIVFMLFCLCALFVVLSLIGICEVAIK